MDFATKKGADPHSSNFWYSIFPTTLKKEKVLFFLNKEWCIIINDFKKHASSMLAYYNNDLASAVIDLYPTIGIEAIRFQYFNRK